MEYWSGEGKKNILLAHVWSNYYKRFLGASSAAAKILAPAPSGA